MYQSIQKNILLQNIQLIVIIQKSENLKNYNDKNIKEYIFFLKNVEKHSFKNV